MLKWIYFAIVLSGTITCADQPVMNEVPRWAGGYGGQVFEEFRWSNDLYDGDSKAANPNRLRYEKHITHFEAVYTFESWIRVTAKLPYVRQKRQIMDNGVKRWQKEEGWDDLKLAVPIRKYVNKRTHSGHYGIVPQVRLPVGDDDGPFPISDGSTDFGWSFTAEYEDPVKILSLDVTHWWNNGTNEGDELSIDTGIGWNFRDNASLKWETELSHERGDNGQTWIGAGPTLFWNFNDVIMSRIEYKFSVYEDRKQLGFGRGDSLRIGIGVVF